jgi:site-specific DNA-methyltransferase (adenine-specific)
VLVRVDVVDGDSPWVGLRRSPAGARFCLVALRGDAPVGGLSPFDSRVDAERTAAPHRASLDAAAAALGAGGALALYGVPAWVLLALAQCPPAFELRHWVAVACRGAGGERAGLSPAHKGLAVLLRRGEALTANTVRVPHALCAACGETLRDWGGRRGRMHGEGTRLSDVWSDLDAHFDDPAPGPLLDRLAELFASDESGRALVAVLSGLRPPPAARDLELEWAHDPGPLRPLLEGPVRADCLELTRALPAGSVDLAFADPPYNLEKAYASSSDRRASREYLAWCNAWLTEYARVVRPGGTLAVLTLPLWAAAHARFLLRHRGLRFDRWIVWDALAEPKGAGLLPAHYALLLFTKGWPRRQPARIDVAPRALCRRAACVTARPGAPRVAATDVWQDIPRLRHAARREGEHPCQLPQALVERLVALTTPPGGVVLDAFCGTGTTGAAALAIARRPILGDVSQKYVEIARERMRASPRTQTKRRE